MAHGVGRLGRALVFAALLCSPAAAQDVLGCYDVTLGRWSPVDPSHPDAAEGSTPAQGPDSMYFSFPPRVELAAGEGWRGGSRLEVPENSLQVPHRFRTWRLDGDTLSLVLSTGFVGSRSDLVRRDAAWVGTLGTFTDTGGTLQYRRSALLEPVDCARPPTVPASTDPALPRAVPLSDGGALELGRSMPDGAALEARRSGAWTAQVEAAAPWAGHDTVVVRLASDGTVHHIELRYPEGWDLTPLTDALAAEYGSAWQPGALGRHMSNRTTEVHLVPEIRPRILLIDPRWF